MNFLIALALTVLVCAVYADDNGKNAKLKAEIQVKAGIIEGKAESYIKKLESDGNKAEALILQREIDLLKEVVTELQNNKNDNTSELLILESEVRMIELRIEEQIIRIDNPSKASTAKAGV